MPRHGGACTSTARKPLSDVSNGAKPSRTCKKAMAKKKKEEEGPGGAGDDALDRLAVAHNEVSKLAGKIDEMVLLAFKHKLTKQGSSEIESFICFLSEMQSSLRAWIQRFEKAFICSSSSAASHDEVKQSPSDKTITDPKRENVFDNHIEEQLMDLVVSPSPLVSWRADTCIMDSGKQLFLLTPLPKSRAASSKRQGISRQIVENTSKKDPSSAVGLPPLSSALKVLHDAKSETTEVKLKSKKKLLSEASEIETKDEKEIKSPLKSPNNKIRDLFVYLHTPRHKSPFIKRNGSQQEDMKFLNATPWGPRNNVGNCTKFLDMQLLIEKPATQSKDINKTFEWFLSPPKTCVLMEPPCRKMPLASTSDNSPRQGVNFLEANVPESTPIWKGIGSSTWKDKNVGESTLKKELWAKFEAISAPGVRFDAPDFQMTSKKGFLEMLDEACETEWVLKRELLDKSPPL